MKHVPPHLWNDVWAGRVGDAERVELERHAEGCRSCARVRARVMRASDTFTSIRTKSSPDLSWDAVRAKVHWQVSTERRAKIRAHRPYGWLAAGVLATAGIAALVLVDHPQPASVPQQASGSEPIVHPVAPVVEAPAALVGIVNRTTGDVMIDGIRPDPAALFERKIAAGVVIATGDGRVDVQFGNGSAFGLGAHSKLELVRFDARLIDLKIEGTVDVAVAPRAAGQRFVVHAGDREIEVRGTQFRVQQTGGATAVACRHGLVALHDANGQIEVSAARHVELAKNRAVATEHATPMSASELDQLAEATPVTMAVWDLTSLATSAPLEIATVGRRDVRLDGVELGGAPLRVRVMPGRHTVEAADSAGRYRRAGWIDVGSKPARLEVRPPEMPATHNVDARRREFTAGIDRARIAACLRQASKQDLHGTYVDIELGIDGQGVINYLNVLDTELGKTTSQCIRTVLEDRVLKPGVAAEWRQRVDL